MRTIIMVGTIMLSMIAPVLGGAAEQATANHRKGEILVKIRPEKGREKQQASLAALVSAASGVGARIEGGISALRYYKVSLPSGLSELDTAAAFKALPNVERADVNRIVKYPISATFPSEDDYGAFEDQWHLHNAADVDIDAPEAWDLLTTTSVVVAMLDTGIDIDHNDLHDNLWVNPGEIAGNGIDDDQNGYVDDIHGWDFVDNDSIVQDVPTEAHGTFSSGLLGAVGNNDYDAQDETRDATGSLWGVKIMMLRMFATNHDMDEYEIISAYDYARAKGVKIVNNSWNYFTDLPNVADAIEDLQAYDMFFIFSAGNGPALDFDGGVDVDQTNWDPDPNVFTSTHLFPCKDRIDNLICVAAIAEGGTKPSFSNWGKAGVHMFAPGAGMFSTVYYQLDGQDAVSTTGFGAYRHHRTGAMSGDSGTSWAAPLVSGVAALTKALNPNFGWRQLRDAIVVSAQPIASDLASLTQTGNVLNARVAAHAFADGFDDSRGDHFFSQYPTNARWVSDDRFMSQVCDIPIVPVPGTHDMAAQATFVGTTDRTTAIWGGTYDPGNAVQTVLMRITTTDGTDFLSKEGRVAVGLVDETDAESFAGFCNGIIYGADPYGSATVGASLYGGINLSDRTPFLSFGPSFPDVVFSALSTSVLQDKPRLSISIGVWSGYVQLRITDSDVGVLDSEQDREPLFEGGWVQCPSPWNWGGATKMSFTYYGTGSDSGTHSLLVREIVSVR